MAIAYVNGQTGNGGTSPQLTAALAGTVSAGDLLVVACGMDGAATGKITSVTGSDGTVFTQVSGIDTAAVAVALDCWTGKATTGGASYQATIVFDDSSTNLTSVIQQFNGFIGTPTVDVYAVGSGTSTSPSSGATATTSDANELVLGLSVHAGTASNFSLGAGYSNLNQRSVANRHTAMENKIVAATGTQTATFTIAASRGWICAAITVKDVTGGSTGQIKVYNGSSFVAKPVKVWNGSAWVVKPLKRWNGSVWVVTPY